MVTVTVYAVFGLVRLYMTSYAALMITTFLASLSFPPMLELTLIISKYRPSPSGIYARGSDGRAGKGLLPGLVASASAAEVIKSCCSKGRSAAIRESVFR